MDSDFESEASGICDDPMDRVQSEMQGLINDPDVRFDVHCHVFNFDCVPDKFLGIRIPLTTRVLKTLEHILHKLYWWKDTDQLSNYAYFINFGRKNSIEKIAIKLFSYHPNTEKMIFCPLMMDMRPGIKGKQKTCYKDQIDNMRDLRDQYPGNLLPFIAIDPNNPEAKDLFIKAFSDDYKFFGVKIYPALGYLPSNPTLMDIFKVCQEKKIPVTAHCGSAICHNSDRYIENISGIRKENNTWIEFTENKCFFTRNSYKKYFNHPKNWEPVLDRYSDLKLNLAHFGSFDEWKDFANGKNNTWVSRIVDLMDRYKNVYTDFSYNICDHGISEHLRDIIKRNSLIASRTLYGSDYYMVVIEGHFRSMKMDFNIMMGDQIMKQIAYENSKSFLFE